MINHLFINFFFLKIKLESNILRKNQVKEPPKEKVQTYRISDYIGVVKRRYKQTLYKIILAL